MHSYIRRGHRLIVEQKGNSVYIEKIDKTLKTALKRFESLDRPQSFIFIIIIL